MWTAMKFFSNYNDLSKLIDGPFNVPPIQTQEELARFEAEYNSVRVRLTEVLKRQGTGGGRDCGKAGMACPLWVLQRGKGDVACHLPSWRHFIPSAGLRGMSRRVRRQARGAPAVTPE